MSTLTIKGWGYKGYWNNKGVMTPKDKFIRGDVRNKIVKYGDVGTLPISDLIQKLKQEIKNNKQ